MEIPAPKSTTSIPKIQIVSSIVVSVVTTAISVLNKLAVRNFNYPSTISLVQGLIVFFGIAIYWGIYNRYKDFSLKHCKLFIPSGIFTAGNFITNFYALMYLNVSTVSVMHNLNLILVAFTDVILFGRVFKLKTVLSLVVITIGAVMYCYGEIQFSLVGFFLFIIFIFVII
jgi:drug/metabolite transporter (DMT)-like permease